MKILQRALCIVAMVARSILIIIITIIYNNHNNPNIHQMEENSIQHIALMKIFREYN